MNSLGSRTVKHRFVVTMLFLLSAAGGALRAATFPEAAFPEGIGIQTKADIAAADHDLIRDSGATFVRKGFYWSSIETTPGVYDFGTSGYDALMTNWSQRGIRVMACLVWNNTLYENHGDNAIITAAGRQAFANYAAACAAHYQNQNVIFEIWNEPNLGGFWRGTSNSDAIADEYTALVQAVVPAMKAADPDCKVVAGSVSCLWSASFSWLERCLEQGLHESGIDGLSVHPYGFRWPELAINGGYGDLGNILTKFGASDLAVVNSEVGYDLGWIEGRGVPAENLLDFQAFMFARQQMIDKMCGVKASNWYEWKTDAWGVVNPDRSLRPTYHAVQTLAQELDGYHCVRRVVNNTQQDYLLVFESAQGQQKLAAWTSPLPGVGGLASPHNVTLGIAASGTLTSHDAYGTPSTLAISGGSFTFEVGEDPQYIELTGPVSEPSVAPEFNLALIADVRVSSGGASAHYLTDGVLNTNSRWMSSGTETYPQWAELDFRDDYTLSKIRYRQYAENTDAYNVQVWNGTAWQTVASSGANTNLTIEVQFTPVVGSKVRFNVLSGSTYQKIYEFEAFGADAPSPDTQPPSVPQGLQAAAVSGSEIHLAWSASTDNVGVTGYDVLRDGEWLGVATTTGYACTGLQPNTAYTFRVAAFDAANNASAYSASSSATTLPDLANIALGKPVTASSGQASAWRLTDGVISDTSRWMSDGTQPYPQWVEVDLQGTYAISELRYRQHSERVNDYQVLVWNGAAWQTVASKTGSTAMTIVEQFAPVVGSKVKFHISAGIYYQKVFELEVYGLPAPPPEPTNVALGRPVTASSGQTSAHYLTDGVISTVSRWMSSGTESYPQWIEVDLQGTYTLTETRYLQYAERTDACQVQVWTGTAWQTVASRTANSDMAIVDTFAPVAGSKVRFTVSAGSYYQKTYEFEVYGY